MPRRRLQLSVVAFIALGLLLFGYLAEDEPDPTPPPTTADPQARWLDEAWSSRSSGRTSLDAPPTLIGDEVVAALGESGRLIAHDAATGARRWVQDPPAGFDQICHVTHQAGGSEIGVVQYCGEGPTKHLVGIELRTGRVLWSRRAVELLGAGDTTATGLACPDESTNCERKVLRRYRLRDGARLPRLAGPSGGKVVDAMARGDTLAVHHLAPDDQAESRHVTELATYALDSGDRLTARRLPEASTDLHALVGERPLVMDVTERGRRFLRVYDDRGRPVRTTGAEQDDQNHYELHRIDEPNRTAPVPIIVDGQVIATRSGTGEDRLTALDPRSGRARWTRRNDVLVGVGERRLLVTREVTTRDARGARRTAGQLTAIDARTGDERILGLVRGTPNRAAVTPDGRMLYWLPEDGTLRKYRVPTS